MDKRSPNFTASEVDYLLEIMKMYSTVIECKKTDRFGAEEKLNAWKDIERDFNSKFTHTFRSYKVLKTKYGNVKAMAKQNFAYDKRQTYSTGGGPQQKTATTKTDLEILEICQEAQILGRPSYYDCDMNENEFPEFEVLEGISEEITKEDGAVGENVGDPEIKKEDPTQWNKYTPGKLKKPINKALQKKKKAETADTWAKVAEMKLEKQKLEVEYLKERQALELERLRLEVEFVKLKLDKLKSE